MGRGEPVRVCVCVWHCTPANNWVVPPGVVGADCACEVARVRRGGLQCVCEVHGIPATNWVVPPREVGVEGA